MPVICQLIVEQKDKRRLSPFLPLVEKVANYPPMPDARKDAMKNNSRQEKRK
jgi:hypothetical protein